MPKLKEVMAVLEAFAPTYLAESWDRVGLMIGSPSQEVNKVLCALDLNEEVVEEAITRKVDCIVTHHPFLFKPIANIDLDTPTGRIIEKLVAHHIAVYAMHTNYDVAPQGLNEYLGRGLGLGNLEVFAVTTKQPQYKGIIYVPQTHREEVRKAVIDNLKTHIGQYEGCTFTYEGEGTFRPLAGSHPAIGREGALERVAECAVSFMAPLMEAKQVIEAVRGVHPYEEMAYDLLALENHSISYGAGRVGQLEVPMTLDAFIAQLKQYFGIDYVKVTTKDLSQKVQRVALVSGAGSDFIADASRVADVFVTGDVKFHEAQMATALGLVVIDVGHYASENKALVPIGNCLIQAFETLMVCYSEVDGERLYTR